jgi:Prophage tail length tape measure protein
MASIVEYILQLKDNLSGGIQTATNHVKDMESSLGKMGSVGKEVLGALGVSFAIFKGIEFVKDGVEAYEKLHQSIAQVEAGLESTHGAAGVTMEGLKEMAGEMSSRMKFGKADIMDMQAQMLTFGGLTKENFPQIGDAIANVAQKIGMDLHGMSIQFGKAMDNPSEGIKKLSRQGVLFSKEQADAIDKLVEKGKIVEAQQIMLTEIQNKYGGSAKAAFDADPLARFTKMMGGAKVAVGEFSVSILKDIVPALESFGNFIKGIIAFVKEHKEGLTEIAKVLGVIIGVYATYKVWVEASIAMEKLSVWWKGISATASEVLLGWEMARAEGMGVVTAAQWALNAAMGANPIGLMIAGIAALSAGLYFLVKWLKDCFDHVGWFRGAVLASWEALKGVGTFIKEIFIVYLETVGHILHGIWLMLTGSFKDGWEEMKNSFTDGGKKLIETAKGIGNNVADAYNKGVGEIKAKDAFMDKEMAFAKRIQGYYKDGTISVTAYANAVANLKNELAGGVKGNLIDEAGKSKVLSLIKPAKELQEKGRSKAGGSLDDPKQAKTKAEGQKNINIHIAINGGLVHEMKIMTTKIEQSYGKIKDQVAAALVSAVNDSQIVGAY